MPCGIAGVARPKMKSLVEVVSSSTRISRPMTQSPSAPRSCSASSRDSAGNMRQLERKIDRARGVGERPDRDVVDTARRDLPDVFDVYAAARLELHILLFPERNSFTHFRGRHVVE